MHIYLRKNYSFVNEMKIKYFKKDLNIYKIGCNKNHVLNKECCDFILLQQKYDEWINSNIVAV